MKSVQEFFLGVRAEFSKIVWPKYDELIGSLIVVLIIVTAFSVYLGGVDFAFYSLAKELFSA